MKYVCLVYHELEKLESVPDAELDAMMRACTVWVEGLVHSGRYVVSMGLENTRSASTVRMRGGRLSVTDGPFAETKEFLGGFTVIEAQDLNEAIQIASQWPAVEFGTVEVRPMLDPTVDHQDPLEQKISESIRRVHGPCLELEAEK